MNPVELKRGSSFKGLATYLLHDVKSDTSERVGWTQSYNLNTASPDRSWRLMANTAMSAEALKAAAGEKATGAKVRKPVYHFTLTWSETDQINDQLQQKAVGEALQALKLDAHQALAVQHTDGKPHVHVMVNLVDPENGTVPKLAYTKKNLRKWANQFEQAHGLEITEGSRQNDIKRKNGEQVDARRKPRNVYEQEKAEANNPRLAWLRQQEKGIAATLQLENKEMQERHALEWETLKHGHHAHRDELKQAKEEAVQSAIDDTKAAYKPKWAALFKQNREALKQFDAGEKSPIAKMFNMGRTFLSARKDGQTLPNSFMAASMQSERRLYVEKENQQREKALAAELRADIAAAADKVRKSHNSSISQANVSYIAQCKALSKTQKHERQQHKQKWREYRERRQQNYTNLTGRGQQQSRKQGRGKGYGQSFEPH